MIVAKAIRESEDPALFVLQMGVTLGILMDRPLDAYHQIRKLLSSFPS